MLVETGSNARAPEEHSLAVAGLPDLLGYTLCILWGWELLLVHGLGVPPGAMHRLFGQLKSVPEEGMAASYHYAFVLGSR